MALMVIRILRWQQNMAQIFVVGTEVYLLLLYGC